GVQRRLWVDRATGTILRSEELDPSRGVILSAYFSRVSFSLNLPEAYFEFRTPAGARVFKMFTTEAGTMSPAALQRRVGFPVLIPPVLPEGYTFRGGAVSRFGSLVSVYLRYSNGGNLISFFEAPAGTIGWASAGTPVLVGGPSRHRSWNHDPVRPGEPQRLRPGRAAGYAAGDAAADRPADGAGDLRCPRPVKPALTIRQASSGPGLDTRRNISPRLSRYG